jgi:hypothetical protein
MSYRDEAAALVTAFAGMMKGQPFAENPGFKRVAREKSLAVLNATNAPEAADAVNHFMAYCADNSSQKRAQEVFGALAASAVSAANDEFCVVNEPEDEGTVVEPGEIAPPQEADDVE